jgi:mRNA-degrading endonuclease toxin of MazEF toxin-antitoxin module
VSDPAVSVARGDVWLAELPDIEPHPAVVISRTDDNARRRNAIVAVITSRFPPRRMSEIALDERNGHEHPSIAQANELATIRLGRRVERRGALNAQQVAALEAAVRFVLDLDVSSTYSQYQRGARVGCQRSDSLVEPSSTHSPTPACRPIRRELPASARELASQAGAAAVTLLWDGCARAAN